MKIVTCPICSSSARFLFKVSIQGENNSDLFSCTACEFAFYPDQNWISKSFSDELNSLDVGATDRTIIAADYLSVLLKSLKLKNGRFLDYGGGYGLLCRIMRDRGFDFENYDPHTRQIFPTSGKAVSKPLEQKYDAVTLIEVALHFEDPVEEFKRLLELSDLVFFTAVLTDNKLDSDWWYLSPETGQHISLFSRKTLEEIANELGVYVTTEGKFFHIFHRDKLKLVTRMLAKRQHLVFVLASLKAGTAYMRRALSLTGSLLEADERRAKETVLASRSKKSS
jgi:hypothetical protein